MNIRKNIDYSAMFAALDAALTAEHKNRKYTPIFKQKAKLLHKEKYHWKQQKYLPEEKKHRL